MKAQMGFRSEGQTIHQSLREGPMVRWRRGWNRLEACNKSAWGFQILTEMFSILGHAVRADEQKSGDSKKLTDIHFG